MARYEFQVNLSEIYTDTMHWDDPNNDHSALLVFNFDQPVNGLNRLAVFCTANAVVSTREDHRNGRLESVYPFSAYSSFARFQSANVPAEGYVYGVWETDASGKVIKLALQLWRPGTVTVARKRGEMDEPRPGA